MIRSSSFETWTTFRTKRSMAQRHVCYRRVNGPMADIAKSTRLILSGRVGMGGEFGSCPHGELHSTIGRGSPCRYPDFPSLIHLRCTKRERPTTSDLTET